MQLITIDFLGPIEQNVQQSSGIRGTYELTFFEQMTRSIDRFKQDANKYAQIVENKNHQEIEKQVSQISLFKQSIFSFGNLCKTVPLSMELMFLVAFLIKAFLGTWLRFKLC